jgi:excisionase family DNA binding protein
MAEILSAEELAEYLGVNYRTVLVLAREGKLPGRRVGNCWRFRKPVIDEWLAGSERVERTRAMTTHA